MSGTTLHYLQHIMWLLHHGHAHQAMLELHQLLWAVAHGSET